MTRITRLLLPTLCLSLFPCAASAQREFGFDNRKPSGQPYLSPEETVKRFKVAPEFEVKLFAAEPDLVNPIAFTIDEKGRVWVVECFEYPKRTPPGKMPRDRIKVLEDTDGDGRCDKATVFAEGKDFPTRFDLASGIEVGYGGVFLGAPPYLWFLQDTDGDGKCDRYEIVLEGFGSQDTHETLNTFQWGPDGRLYGLHGVFTHSTVKPAGAEEDEGVKMNAAVWRYTVPPPEQRKKGMRGGKFEIFAEGTSNPWGMDWRNTDGQFILCCCVIPHLFHISPGGIYKRQAGSTLHPYAYSYLSEICDHTFHRESGWAHAGLIALDTPIMPEKYRNSVIFGSIHGCSIKQNILRPNGSTYTASKGEDFLVSGDKNFRPINMRWGPNGDIYVSDWHDQNPCHQALPDSWDYERGRIYRIQLKGAKTEKAEDLGKRTDVELVDQLKNQNPYRSRTALRLLHERNSSIDPAARKALSEWLLSESDFRALALAVRRHDQAGETALENELGAMNLLGHDNPIFRAWAVRFLGGSRDAGEPTVTGFQSCAKAEKDPTVRRELAAAARTLGERYNTSLLLHALMQHKEDARDPVIPQMIWLAYHSQLAANAKPELDWLAANAPGNPLITDHIVGKAMRRLVATGKPEDLAACVAFLGAVRDTAVREKGLEGLTTALENRQIDPPPEWRAVRAELAKETDPDIRRMVARLSVNFRDRQAMRRALEVAQNLRHPVEERRNAVQDLALVHPPEARAALLGIALGDKEPAELRVEAVRALAGYGQPEISDKLLAGWKSYPPALKDEVVRLLAGRREWARDLLAAVGEKRVARTELTDNTILRIRAFRDRGLNELIEKVWGRYRETPEELGKLIARVRGSLDKGRASFARGRKVFETHCAKCHQFDGTGHEVGPRLDGAERSIDYLLANVLDPNRVVGAPYFMRTVELQSGRIESGLLAEENDQAVTLKLENGVRKVIPRSEIAAVLVNEKSVMPEGLAENMTEQDVRDLIRYVMANPFLTDVTVRLSPAGPGGKEEVIRPEVGPSGRIELPGAKGERKAVIEAEVSAPEEMKTRLLLGSSADVEVRVNGGPEVRKPATGDEAEPDRASVDAALRKGVNRVTIALEYEGNGPVVYARFLDPERKLRYAD